MNAIRKYQYFESPGPIYNMWTTAQGEAPKIDMEFDFNLNLTFEDIKNQMDIKIETIPTYGGPKEKYVLQDRVLVLGRIRFGFPGVSGYLGIAVVAFFNERYLHADSPGYFYNKESWDFRFYCGRAGDDMNYHSSYGTIVGLPDEVIKVDEGFLYGNHWEIEMSIKGDGYNGIEAGGGADLPDKGLYHIGGYNYDGVGGDFYGSNLDLLNNPSHLEVTGGFISLNHVAVGIDDHTPPTTYCGIIEGEFTDKDGNPPARPTNIELDKRVDGMPNSLVFKTDPSGSYRVAVPPGIWDFVHYGTCLNHVIDQRDEKDWFQTVEVISKEVTERTYRLRRVKPELKDAKDLRSLYFCDYKECPKYDECFVSKEGFKFVGNPDITEESYRSLTGGPYDLWDRFDKWERIMQPIADFDGNNKELKLDIPLFFAAVGDIKNLTINADLTENKFNNAVDNSSNSFGGGQSWVGIGPLASMWNGNITNVHTKGKFAGMAPAGLVGIFDDKGKDFSIKKCSSKMKLKPLSVNTGGTLLNFYKQQYGIDKFTGGGLVMILAGEMKNCFFNGTIDVIFYSYMGGLVSFSSGGTIKDSYAVSDAGYGIMRNSDSNSNVIRTYFNSDTGSSNNGYGIPRTTKEMTKPYNKETTYLGWEFGEVWHIYNDINDGYPVFIVKSLEIKLFGSTFTDFELNTSNLKIRFLKYRKINEFVGIGIKLKAEISNLGSFDKVDCFFQYSRDKDFVFFSEKTIPKVLSKAGEFSTKIPEEYYNNNQSRFSDLRAEQTYYVRAGAKPVDIDWNDLKDEDIYWSRTVKITPKNFNRAESFISAPDLITYNQLKQRGREIIIKNNQKLSFDLEYQPNSTDNLEITIDNNPRYLQNFKIGDIITVYLPKIVSIKTRIIEIQELTYKNKNSLKITLGTKWPDIIEKVVNRNNDLNPEARK